ncbi:MAG: tRNA modification GTPase [Gemmataceae bacterium]|nr:tRNA modification GTPase [Gemmataceae bacterium]
MVASSARVSIVGIHPGERRCYEGTIKLPDSLVLPADLYVWPGPRSYTGQDVVEIHVLSCPPLLDAIVAELLHAGARAALPGEFTQRAFLAGKLDLTRAEAVLGVIEAGNRDDLRQALRQLAGGMSQPLHGLREDLLNLLADLEAGLDFTEEDIHFIAQDDLLIRISKGLAQLTLLQKQLAQRGLSGRRFRVVLAGRPNAGKSSLFNALVGDTAALVSPRPGTTRDYLVRHLSIEGITVELVDTAGWQSATATIDEQAQLLGREQTESADLVLLCLDRGLPSSKVEERLLKQDSPPVLGILTKCDLVHPGESLRQRVGGGVMTWLATSTLTGAGLDDLRRTLVERVRRSTASALASSVSRCRHHVDECLARLRHAHELALFEEPPELLALELRGVLDQLGEMVGTVYTDDLLDRIFSRFCIGK